MVQSNLANSTPEHAVSSQVRNLLELLPCAALLYSARQAILGANRLFRELVGYDPDELAQRQLGDITDIHDHWRDDAASTRLLKEQRPELNYEKHFIAKNGTVIRCEVALKRLADAVPVQYLALVRTRGDRRADESELLLQAIDEGFVLLDRDFRVRRINAAALRIDGRPREAILGRTHWEVWPGSGDLPLADAYRKAMRDRQPASIEQLYRHEGHDMWIEARAFPFGEGLAVLYRDVTERKQAEQVLRDSELKFRTIADAMPQMVWSTRPDGWHDYFNRQWYDYTGVTEGANEGEAWPGLFPPEDLERILARWQYSLDTGEPYEIEYQIRHRSGEYRWQLARALPIRNQRGEIVRWMGTCTDIHESVLAQAALRDTRLRLQVALSAAEIGTWTWDIPADRMHADCNLAAMFGIPPEHADDLPVEAYLRALHPDDVDGVRAGLDQALATGGPYLKRFRVVGADGGIRYMQARGNVVGDAAGRPLRMSGAVLDVTRQTQAEEARLVSESKFRTIVESDVIGIIQYRADGTLVKVNDTFLHMLGYSREHFERHGLSWRALTPPEWAEADRQAWTSLEASGRMEAFEKEYVRRDGSRVPVYMGGANFEGSRTEGIAYVLDVSEAKKSEAALRSSELTFRTLADNIPQLAWMADINGDIFWYNNRWFDYTGTTLEEMRGWGWTKVHHPDHVERVVARYRRQIVEEQCTWEDTFPLRGADGQYRWFLSRAMPVRDEHGQVLRWLGTNTDITLQREAELALQRESRRKDDFLAMLAHELRNPLAPIRTASQLLKMDAQNPEYVQRSSKIIDRQVKHISELVDDLMDISRVTRGLASIDRKEVDLQAVITDAVEQSHELIDVRNQKLVLDLRDGGAVVLGDRTRLVQVVVNLLNNSAKYTQQGGCIILATLVRDGEVELSVTDNGIGIDAALLPHVFELFTQAERTPDRSEGGLGLGLALVKSIVALHHGRITAASAGPGMGAAFTVSLPLAHAGPAAARPLRILLVDGEDGGAGSADGAELCTLLAADGHAVAPCPDGPCALARAGELHPDAVLIRTDLPGVDGYALARQLRARDPDNRAVYIALSTSSQSHDRVIARGAGFDHQLTWPVAPAALRKILPPTVS
jgi:PAS domain S-box-containing protein